jgi:hypothetical protein
VTGTASYGPGSHGEGVRPTRHPPGPPVSAEQRRPVGQLTSRQLDLYGHQLWRCLKALGTDAPIRAEVQRELARVCAEQDDRARLAADA